MSRGGVPANTVATSISDQFRNVFSGIDKLSEHQLSLHMNQPSRPPIAQKSGKIPFPLKVYELLAIDVIEKVNGLTTLVSPAVFEQKKKKVTMMGF